MDSGVGEVLSEGQSGYEGLMACGGEGGGGLLGGGNEGSFVLK